MSITKQLMSLAAIAAVGLCGCTVTIGGAGTPSSSGGGGTTPDPDDENLEEAGTLNPGVTDVTVAAGERERYSIHAESGETVILNASLPDRATDVGLSVYSPSGDRVLINESGGPDNLTFVAEETGEYIVEIENQSDDAEAGVSLDLQRIPPSSQASSLLNGVYETTERAGQPVPSTSGEWWVFSDGELASFYSIYPAAESGMSEDVRFWVNAETGATSNLYPGDDVWRVRMISSETSQIGSSLQFALQLGITVQSASELGEIVFDYTFDGEITDGGRTLTGIAGLFSEYDGTVILDDEFTVKLERPGEAQVDDGAQNGDGTRIGLGSAE